MKNDVLDKKVLQEEPLNYGSIVELFKDNLDDARKIISIIDEINKNSEEIFGRSPFHQARNWEKSCLKIQITAIRFLKDGGLPLAGFFVKFWVLFLCGFHFITFDGFNE